MTTQPLLIELLTEITPKALQRLGQAFAEAIEADLRKLSLLAGANARHFATPRRLMSIYLIKLAYKRLSKPLKKTMPARSRFRR